MNHSAPASSPPLLWPMHWALPEGVSALCTTRVGGVSQAPFDALNLGDHVGDDPQAVARNRALLQAELGGARPVFLKQVHGVDVAAVNAASTEGPAADACMTEAPLVACTIMVADCLPLLLTDDAGRVVAAAHAGWRGLAGGVVENTMHAVCAAACVSPAQVRVWLGPCIGPEAFEVGDDVREAFISTSPSDASPAMRYFKPHPNHRNKWLADLAGLARLRLQALGVTSLSGNDSSPGWCTVSQPSRLFSYRRDGVTGRFAVCIWRR